MSYELKDIEIFRVGKHNGRNFTDKDLEILAKSADELDFKPSIKLGHKSESGAPAYGYLQNIRKIKEKLVADFTHLPKEIYQAIKDKRYARVSVEIYDNLNRSGKIFKQAIGAIALLGQEIPGVAGLQTIIKFDADDFEDQHNYDFDIIENTVYSNGEGGTDADSGNNKGVKPMSEEKLNEYKNQIDDLKTQLQTLVDGAASTEETAKVYEQKFEDAQKKLDEVNAKLLAKDADDKAKQVTIPALQNQFKALYTQALKVETKVSVYSVDTKKDEEINMVDVLDTMVGYINDKAKILFSEQAEANTERSEGYDDPMQEVDARINKYMTDNKTDDYKAAQVAVFEADPELKQAYSQI